MADVYLQVVAPQSIVLNGVPSGTLGVVGTASWGPVNTPVTAGNAADAARALGPVQARKYDAMTLLTIAGQQGASDFRVVRVTDGTETAATGVVVTNCLTLTATYPGTFGNNIQAQILAGSKANSFKLVIGAPGYLNETFDNLTGAGNAFWLAAASAVNNGSGDGIRGKSQLVTATAGSGTTAAAVQSSPVALSTGTDGTSSVTTATLVGSDSSRAGMYALRGSKASVLALADADDSTQWTTIDGFALGEGMFAIQVIPAGTSITAAISAKQTAGLDSYASKLMHGDGLYWSDPVNKVIRIVSPQGFAAGRIANLSPQNSSLNKPLYGVIGSQKSGLVGTAQAGRYSTAELSQLAVAGIDVICNPAPAGAIWAVREGINSASNAAVRSDTYSRMTNYIASTLNAGMGIYVGEVINVRLFQRVKATLTSFLQAMLGQGLLGSLDGSLPFSVVCDTSNNPQTRTSLGYLQADVQVQYQGIVFYFIVNLEGGQTVVVSRQTLPSGQVG